MYSTKLMDQLNQFTSQSLEDQDGYYLQRFGVGQQGLEQVLGIAKNLAEGKSLSISQAQALLQQLPGSDPSHAGLLVKTVNSAGMPREAFLEAITNNSVFSLHDAVKVSDRWNRMESMQEVQERLDARFAESERHRSKPQNVSKPFTGADLNSDAHRLEVRKQIENMMSYQEGKHAPRSENEAYARGVNDLAHNTDDKVRREIKETFERRASPNYQPPQAGSLRESLTDAYDNNLADQFEASELGTVRGNDVDGDIT